MGAVLERFPLFPLPLVCLPSEVIPLHVFEERYKTMIGECLDAGAPFGIVWESEDGLREVGCTARVTQVLDRMEDGRMDILVQGEAAFRLLRRVEDRPYPAGDVEIVGADDEPPLDPDAGAAAREAYASLLERATDTRPDEADLGALSAYEMAATVDLALPAKQALLEQRSEDERLTTLAGLFARAVRRIELAVEAGERARSNGRVRR